jgi:RNA polymerase sigma-70 factor (ECF subfamily)
MDDNELIQLVVQRDRDAFITLYDRHSAKVFGLTLRLLGEQMAAEEVTQDTFLKLWTRADTFSSTKGSLLAWLLTIARRTALDRIRLDNRRPDFSNPSDPDDVWRLSPDPDSQTDEARWRSLHFSLLELPDDQRQVIELAYYYSMSQSQIAEFLAIPLGTTKTRLRLGMEKLRQLWIIEKSVSD